MLRSLNKKRSKKTKKKKDTEAWFWETEELHRRSAETLRNAGKLSPFISII